MNFPVLIAAALIPIFTGFIWYHPKVIGTAWMKAADMTEEKIKSANMFVFMGISLLLSFMLAFIMPTMVIHQWHIKSALMNVMDQPEAVQIIDTFMEAYGTEFRSFKHGALHGAILGLFLVLPVVGMNAMYEQKGWKYALIHVAYWTITLALMGGVICQWM